MSKTMLQIDGKDHMVVSIVGIETLVYEVQKRLDEVGLNVLVGTRRIEGEDTARISDPRYREDRSY